MLLLAGTSESGKSTAGAHLAERGVHRVKIRTILTALTSGTPAEHEGVPLRVGFDHDEFVNRVRDLTIPDGRVAVLIESFIDPVLAEATRAAWPGRCQTVFITASRPNRLRRLATARQLTADRATALLDAKDARKRVNEQLDRWRAIADHWIDNDGSHDAYLARLDQIFTDLTAPDRTDQRGPS